MDLCLLAYELGAGDDPTAPDAVAAAASADDVLPSTPARVLPRRAAPVAPAVPTAPTTAPAASGLALTAAMSAALDAFADMWAPIWEDGRASGFSRTLVCRLPLHTVDEASRN